MIEHHAILEAAVQSLTVKRHHRMRGVAEQQHTARGMPSLTVNRAQMALRMRTELLGQVRNEPGRVRELASEEILRRCSVLKPLETGLAVSGQKQGRREAAIGIRERDQHEATARPDVQRVR